MASTDARPIPIKNTALRITFPIYDADGDLVTGAAGLDSEVSKDGGTFTDCTNEATEIATASGMYYLDLTSTEMNADTVAIIVKTSTTGAKTTAMVLYPQESGDVKVDVETVKTQTVTCSAGVTVGAYVGNATAAISVDASGRLDVSKMSGTSLTARDIGASVLLSSGTGTGQISLASGAVTVGTNNDKTGYSLTQAFPTNFSSLAITVGGAVTAGTVSDKTGYSLTQSFPTNFSSLAITAGGAVTAGTVSDKTGYSLASGGLSAITSWTVNVTGSLSGSVGSVTGNVGGNVTGSVGSISGVTFPTNFASLGINASGHVSRVTLVDTTTTNTDMITAAGVRTAVGLASANLDTQLATIAGYVDTEVAAIKAKTDNLPATPASSSDCLTAADVRSAVGLASANLDTQLATIAGYVDTEVAAIKAKTDNLPATPASSSDCLTAAGVRSAVGLASANLDTQLGSIAGYIDTEVAAIKAKTDNLPASPAATGDIPSAATIATQVRTELATELARVDVATSTRLASGSYTAPLDAAGTRAAVGLATANLDTQLGDLPTNAELDAALAGADDAVLAAIAALSVPTAVQVADAVLSRNVSNVEASAPEHSLCTIVLAFLESSVSGGTWTIKRTNGSTTHATKTVTSDAAADPITGVS